jgi:hypothetical protein
MFVRQSRPTYPPTLFPSRRSPLRVIAGSLVAPHKRPRVVTVIVMINLLGWLTTEGLWVYLHMTGQIPPIAQMQSFFERSYIGLVLGFTVADLLWSNLLLLASIVGLWRMRSWGWTAALMANTIWVYAMTVTLVRDIMVTWTAGMLFFLSFAVFALLSSSYLWWQRSLFWIDTDSH